MVFYQALYYISLVLLLYGGQILNYIFNQSIKQLEAIL